MSQEFAGKVALVTGAGGGLGFAHARYLAERGAKVLVNDFGGGTLGLPEQGVEAGMAERAAARIRAAGGEALSDDGSVADRASAEAMVSRALDEWGRLDILVNNAGIASAQLFPDVDDEEMHRHVGVTLMGCLHTMRAAWPHMLEQKFGRIVNTGSAACFGNPVAAYASTKSGLFGLTKSVALFGAPHDIRVNLLLPCAISRLTEGLPETDFKLRLARDFGPEKTSPVVAYLCSEASQINGEVFSVGGGKLARIAYAASPALDIDESVASVAGVIERAMAGDDLRVIHSTHEDMWNLGFPENERADGS